MDRVIYGRRMREVVSLPRAGWNEEWGKISSRAAPADIPAVRISYGKCMRTRVRKIPTLLPDRDVITTYMRVRVHHTRRRPNIRYYVKQKPFGSYAATAVVTCIMRVCVCIVPALYVIA